MKRNRRSGVEDRWYKTVKGADGKPQKVPSARHSTGKRWLARYVDGRGQEHSKSFDRKVDAQRWLDGQTAALVAGTHVAPRDARMTMRQWCEQWIKGYAVQRDSTVRQANTHLQLILTEFGDEELAAIQPSHVKTWVAALAGKYEASYVYALHSRLSQILDDAVLDGLLGRNPCSKRTSPPMGKQKCYVATTEQIWALYDAVPDHIRPAILLGAFAGLRIAEVSGLRLEDVDFTRGIVHPRQQWPGKPLKTKASEAPIPVPGELTLLLSEFAQAYGGPMMVTNGPGTDRCGPWNIDRAIRDARPDIAGLPKGFTHHDLRHFFASLLIADGANPKTLQARMRHESATKTLDVYGHLWPDADESTRTATGKVIAARMDSSSETTADQLRTGNPNG